MTYHGTGPLLDSNSKATECLSIQKVTGLIEYANLGRYRSTTTAVQRERHNYLGVVPETSSDDELDLLPSRQSRDLVVLGDISVQADVLEMFTDQMCRGITGAGALTGRFNIVELLHELRESFGEEVVAGHPGVELVI